MRQDCVHRDWGMVAPSCLMQSLMSRLAILASTLLLTLPITAAQPALAPAEHRIAATFDTGKAQLDASDKDNIVPGIALTRGDFHALSAEQTRRVGEKMRSIVDSRHLPRTNAMLEIEENYPPVAPTAGNRALPAKLNELNRDLGLEAMGKLDPLLHGAGDISLVAADMDGAGRHGRVRRQQARRGRVRQTGITAAAGKTRVAVMHRLARTPR